MLEYFRKVYKYFFLLLFEAKFRIFVNIKISKKNLQTKKLKKSKHSFKLKVIKQRYVDFR